MPGNLLLSGPAGAGKSQLAQQLVEDAANPTVTVGFQEIYALLLGIRRQPNGRYPERRPEDDWVMPMAEYMRRVAITRAVQADLSVIATNSDGSPERRRELLRILGADSTEQILDPGENVVRARLSDPVTGGLSRQCETALNRWYRRYGEL